MAAPAARKRRLRAERAEDASAPPASAEPTAGRALAPSPALSGLWWTALAALFGAQFIHWSVIDSHTEEWFWSGAFFFSLAVSQGLLGAGLAVTRSRRLALAAIAVSLVATGLWALDRSVGLPVGPEAGTRGLVGRSDLVASVLQLLTAGGLAPFVAAGGHRRALVWPVPADARRGGRAPLASGGGLPAALSVVGVAYVAAVTVFALAGP